MFIHDPRHGALEQLKSLCGILLNTLMEKFPQYLLDIAENERILFAELDRSGFAQVWRSGRKLVFLLNSRDGLDENVLAFMHELVHFHPRFMSYTGKSLDGSTLDRDEDIEREIEDHARQVVKTRPDVVRVLKRRIVKERFRDKREIERIREKDYNSD